jgi:NADH dehydrogenase
MILVTGATGFVGRRVVAALASRGHPVRALVHTPSRASVLSHLDVEVAHGDVLDAPTLEAACEGVDGIVHLVAAIRETRERDFRTTNHQGAKNLLEAAVSAGVGRIVYASALGAMSDPYFRYMYSRWMAEQEVARSGIPYCIIRFSVAFGDGDEFFNAIAAQVKLSPFVPSPGDGRARFQPIAVQDVARCLTASVERDDLLGSTLEVGGPEHMTYDEMIDLVSQTMGARTVIVHVPLGLMMPAARLMEAALPRPPATREQLKMLKQDSAADPDSVVKLFGFKPISARGNIDYVKRIGLLDALKLNLGRMPEHIRDH